MTSGRRALCLGLLAVACDVKVGGEQQTKPPGRRSSGSKRQRGGAAGYDEDPAVVQAAVELEREAGMHLRLTGEADGATHGRTAAALREAVLRRGGGRIAAERVHVATDGGGAVQFEFYYPQESTPPPELTATPPASSPDPS